MNNNSVHGKRIIVADDDPQMQLALKASLSRGGYDVLIVPNGKVLLEKIATESFDLIITDQKMPELDGLQVLSALRESNCTTPCIMITAYGTINQAVEAMQFGAADFISKPFSSEDLIRVIERVLSISDEIVAEAEAEIQAGAGLTSSQESSVRKKPKSRAIITNDPVMIRMLEVAEAVARSDATILVQGESGTGKELVARLIHTSSRRASGAFVAVNCAALPASLLESELFGHEKGAFTGAQSRKIGKFELAQGGTILLDEISEMDILLQAKLLRVLQEREVDRVGGSGPISIDVRVVATTNRNLEEEVRNGRFRADLYYRLNVIPLTLPALRQRQGDIALLAKHFIRHFLGKDLVIPPSVMESLQRYPWPGNIRELQNAIERGAILCQGNTPKESDFLLGANPIGSSSGNNPSVSLPFAPASGQFAHSPLASEIEVERIIERPVMEPPVEETPFTYVQIAGSSDANQSGEGSAGSGLASEIVSSIEGFGTAVNIGSSTSTSDEALIIRSGMTVGEVEKVLIMETLKDCSNNRTQAAKLLGISIRTLRNKLAEYRMDS